MEISNEVKAQTASQPAASPGASPQTSTQAPPKLAEGAVIKGEITDLKQDQVTIRTEDGQVITAKLAATSDAAIGQIRGFTARYSNGQLTLTVNELPAEALNSKALSEMLKSLGFKGTEENIRLAEIALNNQLPMTKETLMKLNQAIKLMGPENVDKALFLMENEIRVNSQNAETLKGFINGETKIQSQLKSLLANLEALPAAERHLLTEVLLKGEAGLGEGKLIEKLVADVKTAATETAAAQKIAEAFGNENLPVTAFAKLGEQLVKEFPQHAELIQKLAAQKTAFIETVAQAAVKPELSAKLTEAVRSGTLTAETLTRIASEAGIEIKNPTLAKNEMRQIIDLIPVEESIKQRALEMLKLTDPSAVKPGDANQKLLGRLSFALNSSDPKEIDAYLNGLRGNLDLVKAELLKLPVADASKILKDIGAINQNLEFVSQLKSNLFLQLPITVDGHNTNSELFVFRDKHRQTQSKKNGTASAMIALDTVNMGRFETYLQKTGDSVNCQFRLEGEGVERLVRANLPKLESLLGDYNYSLDGVTFRALGEAFSLIDKEPSEEGHEPSPTEGVSRITFDIRT